MRWLSKFSRLTPENQWYLIKTSALMMFVKIGLRFMSFRRLRALLVRWSEPHDKGQPEAYRLRRALEAVELASRKTPLDSTCLVRALTGQVLLAKAGISSELRIGVMRGATEKLEAHAWVIYQGEVIIGYRDDLHMYRTFSGLEERLR